MPSFLQHHAIDNHRLAARRGLDDRPWYAWTDRDQNRCESNASRPGIRFSTNTLQPARHFASSGKVSAWHARSVGAAPPSARRDPRSFVKPEGGSTRDLERPIVALDVVFRALRGIVRLLLALILLRIARQHRRADLCREFAGVIARTILAVTRDSLRRRAAR
jgi:hypothetical protein